MSLVQEQGPSSWRYEGESYPSPAHTVGGGDQQPYHRNPSSSSTLPPPPLPPQQSENPSSYHGSHPHHHPNYPSTSSNGSSTHHQRERSTDYRHAGTPAGRVRASVGMLPPGESCPSLPSSFDLVLPLLSSALASFAHSALSLPPCVLFLWRQCLRRCSAFGRHLSLVQAVRRGGGGDGGPLRAHTSSFPRLSSAGTAQASKGWGRGPHVSRTRNRNETRNIPHRGLPLSARVCVEKRVRQTDRLELAFQSTDRLPPILPLALTPCVCETETASERASERVLAHPSIPRLPQRLRPAGAPRDRPGWDAGECVRRGLSVVRARPPSRSHG